MVTYHALLLHTQDGACRANTYLLLCAMGTYEKPFSPGVSSTIMTDIGSKRWVR